MPVSRSALRTSAQAQVPPTLPAPYWTAPRATLHLGHAVECLRRMEARSVHCVITSPPYWGLRDYGTGTWEGGNTECDHKAPAGKPRSERHYAKDFKGGLDVRSWSGVTNTETYRKTCAKCGAKRTDAQLGLEETHDCLGWVTKTECGKCYVCHMVEVFQKVKRVLRDDGTLWLNLGDTFDSGQVMVPTRVALALQADGWKLIQDIIWYAPNKMPESVTNRCSKSHEHIFLLAKSDDYYFDHVAIQEDSRSGPSVRTRANGERVDETKAKRGKQQAGNGDKVNKRDVWVVPTKGYPGAHFATFSPRLITPCILAGTSEHGVCSVCGKPWERVIVRTGGEPNSHGESLDNLSRDRSFDWSRNGKPSSGSTLDGEIARKETVGWRKVCGCHSDAVVPAVVMDPFVGSGTTVAVAIELGRSGVGCDLSEVYLRENAIPRIEAAIGGGVSSRPPTVAVPSSPPPSPRRLRGSVSPSSP